MVQEGLIGYALRKYYSCKTFVKTDGLELQYSIPAQPSPFTRYNGKCNICILDKEIKLFEANFLHIIATRKDQKSEAFYGKIDRFDRFMTSEGTETLIFGLTSKTGQSVVHTRHRIF